MTGSICSKVTKYYALNALMKLSTRFSTETERIQKVIHACVILINVTLEFLSNCHDRVILLNVQWWGSKLILYIC